MPALPSSHRPPADDGRTDVPPAIAPLRANDDTGLDARTIAWAHVLGMLAVLVVVLALIDALLPLIRRLAGH